MKELTNETKLEKWLESVGASNTQACTPKIKEELAKYFDSNQKPKQKIVPKLGKELCQLLYLLLSL
jgi:hypothetical protein